MIQPKIYTPLFLLFLFLCDQSFAQERGEYLYNGDIAFVNKDYEQCLNNYDTFGFNRLPLNRFTKAIEASYYTKNHSDSKRLIVSWLKQGMSPNQIEYFVTKRFKNIDSTFSKELFSNGLLRELNELFGLQITSDLNFYFNIQRIFHNDQHLRQLERQLGNKIDRKTFYLSDSLNYVEVKGYFEYKAIPGYKKWCLDLLVGIIHHYSASSFFTNDDFKYFQIELFELVKKDLLDLYDYCYFVDKYKVFHHENQLYGTYKEMEGYVLLPSVEIINNNRKNIGYLIDFETSSKYGIQ